MTSEQQAPRFDNSYLNDLDDFYKQADVIKQGLNDMSQGNLSSDAALKLADVRSETKDAGFVVRDGSLVLTSHGNSSDPFGSGCVWDYFLAEPFQNELSSYFYCIRDNTLTYAWPFHYDYGGSNLYTWHPFQGVGWSVEAEENLPNFFLFPSERRQFTPYKNLDIQQVNFALNYDWKAKEAQEGTRGAFANAYNNTDIFTNAVAQAFPQVTIVGLAATDGDWSVKTMSSDDSGQTYMARNCVQASVNNGNAFDLCFYPVFHVSDDGTYSDVKIVNKVGDLGDMK